MGASLSEQKPCTENLAAGESTLMTQQWVWRGTLTVHPPPVLPVGRLAVLWLRGTRQNFVGGTEAHSRITTLVASCSGC